MTENNNKKINSITEFVKEESRNVLNAGFYGKMVFVFAIEDGNIQEIETQVIRKRK